MKIYKFAVSLCGGWCDGTLNVKAENEDTAYTKVTERVLEKLNKAFPSLSIDYNVECENPVFVMLGKKIMSEGG